MIRPAVSPCIINSFPLLARTGDTEQLAVSSFFQLVRKNSLAALRASFGLKVPFAFGQLSYEHLAQVQEIGIGKREYPVHLGLGDLPGIS